MELTLTRPGPSLDLTWTDLDPSLTIQSFCFLSVLSDLILNILCVEDVLYSLEAGSLGPYLEFRCN